MRSTLLSVLPFLTLSINACSTVNETTHTFYGYPDNDPPGPNIAYNCGRGKTAGGTGTFADPLTFASAPGAFDQCEVIYDPYLRKYLVFEDYCQQCDTDWKASPRINHVDVWTGSPVVDGGQAQIQCENDLTPMERSQTIVRQPREDLPVNSAALYVKRGRPACRTGNVYGDYAVEEYC